MVPKIDPEHQKWWERFCSALAPEKLLETAPIDLSLTTVALKRVLTYLESTCNGVHGFQCVVSPSRSMDPAFPCPIETFFSALILDIILPIPELNPAVPRTLLYFLEQNYSGPLVTFLATPQVIPDDVECTALMSMVLWKIGGFLSESDARVAASRIIKEGTLEESGVIQVLFPSTTILKRNGPYETVTDPVPLANVLRLLYAIGMEESAKTSEDFLVDWLENRAEEEPYYYHKRETLIFILSGWIMDYPKAKQRFQKRLTEVLINSLGTTESAMDCAMRLIAASNLKLFTVHSANVDANMNGDTGAKNGGNFVTFLNEDVQAKLKRDLKILKGQQLEDGGFPIASLFKTRKTFYGGRCITSALAARAFHDSRFF